MTRILWIGCHKLLVKTELVTLRNLGYEVYRPTYLSKIYDQSAVTEVDSNPSSLSEDILDLLGRTNFFYEPISERVSKVINEHFDVCVVTISPNWLNHLASAYKGKIIYRTFGQPYSLSTEFETIGLTNKLINRENFYFLPHTLKSLESEHHWLIRRAIEVPYWIENEVFEMEKTWDLSKEHTHLGLLCPNIENPYYNSHYQYLKKHFSKKLYKIFGVQKNLEKEGRDKWVVGTLDRQKLLREFQNLAGFLYTYHETNTCYLPPIEAIVMGVPVLYPQGSLLSKYIGPGQPGEWNTEKEANELAKRLLNRDVFLINSILTAQEPVKNLYREAKCLPRFAKTFQHIIDEEFNQEFENNNIVIIPFYFPGNLIKFDGLNYSTSEGIPRVIKFYSDTLCNNGYKIKILVYENQIADAWGYFNQDRINNLVEIVSINSETNFTNLISSFGAKVKPIIDLLPDIQKNISRNILINLLDTIKKSTKVEKILKKTLTGNSNVLLIPHYYHFRDLHETQIKIKTILYLPDYIPYLFPSKFKNEIKNYEKAAIKISAKADLIITNSEFTAEYLPKSNLKVDPNKIRVFPLPRLGSPETFTEVTFLQNKSFFFYPTQFRPNKRIDLLFKAFDTISNKKNIYLVLTGNLDDAPELKKIYTRLKNKERIFLLGSVSDSKLNWLYTNCTAVVVTSESEGNFPTQLTEAIFFNKPFIAARIKVVLEGLDFLPQELLFDDGSKLDLLDKMQKVLKLNSRNRKITPKLGKAFTDKQLEVSRKGIISVVREAINPPGWEIYE